MQKLSKAWVTTHTRADGKKFYTAHAIKVSKIFWFIPIFWEYHVVLVYSKTEKSSPVFGLYYTDNYYESYQFETKQEAEEELMNQINIVLDRYNEEVNKKVVKRERSFLSYIF